ncbi:hypothetical protein CSV80_00640 [Sporosarcina sp. P12(2017)]|uniref:hypothetical protein n=1 Tax=unclassified Sporosarcina TaxID=2647733 RepID=UPI000C16A548|nr:MULTISPECIES: hypothetical protein [unclassified Sporosarcina]PIC59063.1 hypothetical protein CSV81_00640 [Sporosarcina sp. P10]PIC62384.1 hypothetical protein CSV80_00640 [Sporosarcina sp. P12(2017)]
MNYSSLLNKLYTEMYEPKLLPQDLLDNLSHKNYISVDFYKRDDLLIGNTKCYLANGVIGEYEYIFKDNKLIRLEAHNEKMNAEILYDRQEEISKLKNQLNTQLNNYSTVS